MGEVYLDASFHYVTRVLLGRVHAVLEDFLSGQASLTALSVLAFLLLHLLVFRRIARTMDRDMKRTRGTLLMFPTDVLAGVAQFVNASGGMTRGGGGRGRGGDSDGGSDGEFTATGTGSRLATEDGGSSLLMIPSSRPSAGAGVRQPHARR
jgi:hypothetical protein